MSGAYLAAVRRSLRHNLGAHVRGLFWDFASLPQKPRSDAEGALFAQALGVMGDVYASALGTTVLRHRAVPARPKELDGEVLVLVEAGGALDDDAGEAALRRALGAHGSLKSVRREKGAGRWSVRFASHAVAEKAAAAAASDGLAGASAVFCFHNGRPYGARG